MREKKKGPKKKKKKTVNQKMRNTLMGQAQTDQWTPKTDEHKTMNR